MPLRRVVLYTKAGCHLCEIAKGKLERARREHDFDLEEVDIARDPVLLERYGLRIPVVAVDGVESFEHRVILEDLLRALRAPLAPSYESGTQAPES